MDINTPVENLNLIGTAYAKKLKKLGIYTLKDLLFHIPFRFEDTRNIIKISDVLNKANTAEIYTIKGVILDIENIYTRYGKKITQAVIQDESGCADIIWFNQTYLTKSLPKGSELLISGKVSYENIIRPKFISPTYEKVTLDQSSSIHLGKLTPVYPETEGISSKWLRARISEQIKIARIDEWLDQDILKQYDLMPIDEAIKSIHFPENIDDYQNAKERIAFDEMLLIQLLMQERKKISKRETAQKIKSSKVSIDKFLNSLDFKLTKSQLDSAMQILEDIGNNTPMNRLLEGEVGSGKTVVAAIAVYHALNSDMQIAFMAPTSILAKQHYNTLTNILKPIGFGEDQISLVTNKSKPQKDAKLFIGTHALLFQENILDNISLVIIDEQHRFGVNQREAISNSKGKAIHSLTMTATPIPRTLALSIYGDLDISYINELPKGRQEIITRIVPNKKREDMYNFVKEQIKAGRQAFIVCPLIDQSEKINLKSAKEEFEVLQTKYFKDFKLALLHGQMKTLEKDMILEDFKDKKFDILVSTPVVEVGIDIPNANVMIVEGAERFGLAQLHQLRGRVGRGQHKSYCFLLTTDTIKESIERLRVFANNTSGLEIANFDLKSRGPGEVYGVKQSGIPTLKAASFMDISLITKTKKLAEEILNEGLDKNQKVKNRLVQFKREIETLN